MANIVSYINHYASIPMSEMPYNDIDNVIEETPSVDPAKVQAQAPAPAHAPQQVQQVQPVQAVQQPAPVAPQTPMPQNVQQPVPNNQTNQVQ